MKEHKHRRRFDQESDGWCMAGWAVACSV